MAYLYKNPYQQPLLAAQQELAQRRGELAFVQQRIAQLEATINALEPLAQGIDPADFESVGLPILCLEALSTIPDKVAGASPKDIKELLALRGIELNYSNPMAVIHTTIMRLKKAGDIEVTPTARFRLTAKGAMKVAHRNPRFFAEGLG